MGHVCGGKEEDARTGLALLDRGTGTDERRVAVELAAARPKDLAIPAHVCVLRGRLLVGFGGLVRSFVGDVEGAGTRDARMRRVAVGYEESGS